jgi:deoxyribonuclease V
MRCRALHAWDIPPREAIEVQKRLCARVETEDRLRRLRRVAGLDVGFDRRREMTRAAVAVLAYPTLEVVESRVVECPTTFPYVPGLLSFREIPALIEALTGLEHRPDLLICDGQGLAHPRRFGLASHLGLITDTPAIGAAKSRLVGRHDEPATERGSWCPLVHEGERVGAVLRTRTGVKPLYVSVGHRVSLPTAIELVLAVTPRWRLPETTRQAHRLASG